jgi:AcrR family transcriptional regulator
MVVTPWGDSETLRDRGLRPGPGIPPEEAAANQRERLFAAMVASVSERGYAATTVADLVELSGVARKSFYRLFDDKQACFIAAVQATLAFSIHALTTSVDGDWRQRVRADMHMLAEGIALQPAVSRMVLIEADAAGPEALAPLEATSRFLEEFGRNLLAESVEWAEMPAEITPFHAGAAQAIARRCLYEGSEAELPALIEELSDLILSYPPPPEPIRTTTRPPAFPPETIEAHDRSERALRAFTAVVAERGYGNASVRHAIKRAAMSPTTFYASFRDKEDAMAAAIDSGGAQLVAAIMPTFRRNPDWPVGVRAALGTFFNFLASRPSLARLMVVEVHAAGPEAVARREAALAPLQDQLGRWQAWAPQVPAITIEALRGGVFGLAFKAIKEGGPDSLPDLAAICTYFTLAPFIGAEAACAAANGDGLPRSLRERRDAEVTILRPLEDRVLWFLGEQATSVAAIAEGLDAPLEEVAEAVKKLKGTGMIDVRPEAPGPDGERDRIYISPRMRLIAATEWGELSRLERERISGEVLNLIAGDVEGALGAKTLDARTDRHLVRVVLLLDEQGWKELVEIHTKVVNDTVEIQAKTMGRLRESGEAPMHARSIVVLMEAPED